MHTTPWWIQTHRECDSISMKNQTKSQKCELELFIVLCCNNWQEDRNALRGYIKRLHGDCYAQSLLKMKTKQWEELYFCAYLQRLWISSFTHLLLLSCIWNSDEWSELLPSFIRELLQPPQGPLGVREPHFWNHWQSISACHVSTTHQPTTLSHIVSAP